MKPAVTDICEQIDMTLGSIETEIRAVRRHLHQHPEPGGEEVATTAYLAERLEAAGIEFRLAPSARGLIADSAALPGRSRVALRADIDALCLQDEKRAPYRSTRPMVMHACGHDAHTAMLFGALVALHRAHQHTGAAIAWRGIFQPAEETALGALEMVAIGALAGVHAIVALHVDPVLPVGVLGWRHGPLTAGCDDFVITVHGRGGHAARPHQTADPVAAAVQVIQMIYGITPRTIDARDPAVVSVGMINAGSSPNVIPEFATIEGTMRAVNPATAQSIRSRLRGITEGVGRATDTRISIEFPSTLAGVINDPAVTDTCRRAAEPVFPGHGIVEIELPSMGGEDFANYLAECPGAMFRLGVGTPGNPLRVLHSPDFDIDENALVLGARFLARSALALGTGSNGI